MKSYLILFAVGNIQFDDINSNQYYGIGLRANNQCQLAKVIITRELSKRLQKRGLTNVKTYCTHPGIVDTQIFRNINPDEFEKAGVKKILVPFLKVAYHILTGMQSVCFKTPEEGARTIIHCAISDSVSNDSGCYYE